MADKSTWEDPKKIIEIETRFCQNIVRLSRTYEFEEFTIPGKRITIDDVPYFAQSVVVRIHRTKMSSTVLLFQYVKVLKHEQDVDYVYRESFYDNEIDYAGSFLSSQMAKGNFIFSPKHEDFVDEFNEREREKAERIFSKVRDLYQKGEEIPPMDGVQILIR